MPPTTTAAESAEAAVAAFSAYGARAISAIEAQRAALPADLPALLPELIARLDAQRTAVEANAAFLGTMLSELDLVPPDATPADDDDALLRAVASARAAAPEITAKALHAQLAAQPRWASLPTRPYMPPRRVCRCCCTKPAAARAPSSSAYQIADAYVPQTGCAPQLPSSPPPAGPSSPAQTWLRGASALTSGTYQEASPLAVCRSSLAGSLKLERRTPVYT